MRVVQLKHLVISPDEAPGGVEMDWVAELTTASRTQVHFARFAPGDTLPRHPTPTWQVFAVVQGQGFVAADDDVRHPVSAGTAAVWSPGEEHTSWAETPMLVVIVQSVAEPTAGTI